MRMAAARVLALILAGGVTARAETDVFIRTVGFALTGSDDADPRVIGDRAKSVFAIKNDIFRLNNVHTDRITIQGWQRQQGLEQLSITHNSCADRGAQPDIGETGQAAPHHDVPRRRIIGAREVSA